MPKQRAADGTVKVEFKTKDGKTVLFSRKAKKDKKPAKETPAPEQAAASEPQAAASKKKTGKESGERPTDLQPVLILTDD